MCSTQRCSRKLHDSTVLVPSIAKSSDSLVDVRASAGPPPPSLMLASGSRSRNQWVLESQLSPVSTRKASVCGPLSIQTSRLRIPRPSDTAILSASSPTSAASKASSRDCTCSVQYCMLNSYITATMLSVDFTLVLSNERKRQSYQRRSKLSRLLSRYFTTTDTYNKDKPNKAEIQLQQMTELTTNYGDDIAYLFRPIFV
eukprot:COSAG02_NODE_1129_length_14415_cov_828.291911_1_plen_200_part_00